MGGAALLPDENAPWDTSHLNVTVAVDVVCCLNSPLHFSRPTFSKCASSCRLGRSLSLRNWHKWPLSWGKTCSLELQLFIVVFSLQQQQEKEKYRNANPFWKYFALAVVILRRKQNQLWHQCVCVRVCGCTAKHHKVNSNWIRSNWTFRMMLAKQ